MDFAALRAHVERWIGDDLDASTRHELRVLLDAPDLGQTDLADRFAGSLAFGTAGLRGILGGGPNRMNRAVAARATWALARELEASVTNARERIVVVGGDARRGSREMAEDAASILAASGFRVVLFASPVPTPLVGFAVRRLRAAGGIVITASHNPPEYNGYKVYWENACPIVPPVDAHIGARIERGPSARDIARPPLDALRASGRLCDPPDDLESSYVAAVRSLSVYPSGGDRRLGIVYTPLHGVGNALMRRVLHEAGFTAVTSVAEQAAPDGAFPTITSPNPEEPGAMDLALARGAELGADLVLANDPDVDRLAVAVRGDDGLRTLTGNEIGVLLGHHLLTDRPAGARPRAIVSSIVSSPLLGRIAADRGVHYEETLTGFKWIAKRSLELEESGYEFVFGYEEALGYCVGNVVHDKDGISAALLVAELAAARKAQGLTLVDELEAIARRWGAFTSAQVSITRAGADGAAEIGAMMDRLRSSPPRHLGGDAVVAISDYRARERCDLRRTGGEARTALRLPVSNVIAFELASGGRAVARPSGTEPKAKFYFDACEPVRPHEPVAAAAARARAALRAVEEDFVRLLLTHR